MSKNVLGARLIHKSGNTIDSIPTSATTNDHTLGWLQTDIYKSELYINTLTDRAWTRTDNGIVEFIISRRDNGALPDRYMPHFVDGDFVVSSGLTVTTLEGSGNRSVLVNENGTFIIGGGLVGSGTVTNVMGGNGIITSPSSGITGSGNVSMGTPYDVTSISVSGLTYLGGHSHKFIPAGNTTEIQINSGNTLRSSSKFRYDGIDLYVSGMTSSGTSYSLYYDIVNGRISYNVLSSGTVSSIKAGSGLSFTDITTSGYVTLGTPSDITYLSINEILSTSHTHAFVAAGSMYSIQYKSFSGGISGNSNFYYNETDLYVSGMTNSQTPYMMYYNPMDGQITYSNFISGTVSSVSAGSGMSFTNIITTGYITMGTPSDITSGSTNIVFGSSHSHAFIPAGNSTEIQFNNGGYLSSSPNLTFDGTSLLVTGKFYVSGMTADDTQSNMIYYNVVTKELTWGLKPAGGGGGGVLLSGVTSTFTTSPIVVNSYLLSNKYATYSYCIYSGETNMRAGLITLVNSSSTVELNDSSTVDIGSTIGVEFTWQIGGGNVDLLVVATSGYWNCNWTKIV